MSDLQADRILESPMIDAPGVITAIDDKFALVLMDETGCGRCHEDGGCGGNNLGKMLCSAPRTFRVRNPGNFRIGARVHVAIAEGAVRRSAMLAYALPLLMLFVGASAGSAIAGEPGAIVGAVAGLLCAWLALRLAHERNTSGQRFEPYIRY